VFAFHDDDAPRLIPAEHGYFVLRFLAEDVGKCLDQVLDAILGTLSGRRGSSVI
jgi:very-short-patch-repair endonuclease